MTIEPAADLTLWQLCVKGGVIMIPLALLAIICIYVFVERLLVVNRASKHDDPTFMKRIKDYIHEGEIESALNLCRNSQTAYSTLIAKGLSRIGRPMQDILVTIENIGKRERKRGRRG